jgi:hypothetical protein
MPRPKPPEPLLGRQVRMSDRQWIMFNELGGADWLRKLVEKKAPMPKKYYDNELARIQNPADATFLKRRQGEIND